MKKILSLKLFILLLLLNSVNSFADEIWSKNFANELNKGYWGSSSDVTGITDWNLDVSLCNFSDDSDYVKVVETGGGRLEAVDCDGEAVWTSKAIDISGFTECHINMLVAETGTSTNQNKYIRLFYKLDRGEEQAFTVNAENIGNWGRAEASAAGISGNELVLIVRMNNPLSSNKVYFDDILITGNPKTVEKDKFTMITAPVNQVQGQSIKTDQDTEDESVSCFRFAIDETEAAGDALPTKISRMTFFNANPANGTDWESQLGGVILYSEGVPVNYESLHIDADSLYFDFLENQLSIPDGGKMEFELRAYLNSEVEQLDGADFQLLIESDARGFTTFDSGSSFHESGTSIRSESHKINVEASKLIFAEVPASTVRNQHFNLSIWATDEFGNLDTDQEDEISLYLQEGNEELLSTGGLRKSLENGLVQFNDLKYQAVEVIRVLARGDGLPEIVSPEIAVQNTYESELISTSWLPGENVVSALQIDKRRAFKLFEFAVQDSGDDEAPTVLKKVPIAGSESNQSDFTKRFAGFFLTRDGQEVAVDFEISKNKIDLLFREADPAAIVESEDISVYSLFAYFVEGNCIDGEIIQLKIDQSSEAWEVSVKDSGLKPVFENEVTGPKLICQVEAVEMRFGYVPKSVKPNVPFSLEIEFLDELSNMDTDLSQEIKISLAAGTGELLSESGLSKTLEDGRLVWTDVIYNKAEHFSIQAEAEGFATILSDNVSSVDQNSSISLTSIDSNFQLSASSLSPESASSVLQFTIADSASFDELPTIINTAIFYMREHSHSFDWEKHIAGAIIRQNGEIIAHSSDIKAESIRFNSSKGILEVESGNSQVFELAIYFRETALPDNTNFQVNIPGKSAWKEGVNSSLLSQGSNQDITSEIFELNIVADRLRLVSSPLYVGNEEEPFNLKLVACDQDQNIDRDHSGEFTLEPIEGDGELIHENVLELKNGIAELQAIQYTGSDLFKLRVASDIGSDTVCILTGENLLDYANSFETAGLHHFLNVNDWSISTYRPIRGKSSLKHNLSQQAGKSYISKELDGWRAGNGATRWSFILRNGDWDPSSANYFVFHLCMDDQNPDRAKIKYSIGVNIMGATDLLSFWKTGENHEPELLAQANFNWNEEESVAIQVDYHPDGKWSLAYNRLGLADHWDHMEDVYSEIGSIADTFYYGLEYHFQTASRAGELWLDDLKVQAVNTPPYIKSYQIQGEDAILITFSEDLDMEQELTPGLFQIHRNGEEISSFHVSFTDRRNEILLLFDAELRTGKYQLQVHSIADADGAYLKSDQISFEYLAQASVYDIVINEIMADESPAQGLPEFEYIELYNTKTYPISLADWIMKIGDKELHFPMDTIQANSHLILCSHAAVEEFSEYGDVTGLSGFSGLTNAGNSLQLISSKGLLIDAIHYSDSWYGSEEKSDGGWSLERIDPLNHAWQDPNWTASISEKGGTPGGVNSVFSDNKDLTPPEIIEIQVQASNLVQIRFSEPMQEEQVAFEGNYFLMPGQIPASKVVVPGQAGNWFEIQFAGQFMENLKYSLLISERLTDLAGNQLKNKQVEFWVPSDVQRGDIVINELLFNPLPGGSDYLELYNTSENIYDLSKLYLGKKNENYKLTDSVNLSAHQDLLHPKEYCVFSADTMHLLETYFTSNSSVFHQLNLPNFPDEAGRVVLYTNDDLIDEFIYSESMHFELLASKDGVALERINPGNESNKKENWQSAAQNVGFGTPGLQNSVFNEEEIEGDEITLSSKAFTPDQDGMDDRLYINFNLKEDGYVANIRIYDSRGKEIRKLASNLYLGRKDQIFWDGLNSRRERLPVGIYLLYIEMFHPDGEVKAFKKTCVLAGKFK